MRKQDRKGSTDKFQMITSAPKWNSRVEVDGEMGTVVNPGFVDATVKLDNGNTVTVPHDQIITILS